MKLENYVEVHGTSDIEKKLDEMDRRKALIIWANVFGLIAAVWILLLAGATPPVLLASILSITVFMCGEAIYFEELFW